MSQDARQGPTSRRRRRRRLLVVLALLLIGIFVARGYWRRGRAYEQQAPAFQGGSELLQNTVIMTTLDTPVPPGKNAVWCASFELAWNHLRSEVIKGPVKVAGAEAVAERLNASSVSEKDLAPESCFATAGLASEGIRDRIRREMAARFPGRPAPEIDADAVVVAYAYLSVAARSTIPFFENNAELGFRDGAGSRTAVASFGIRPEDEYAYRRLREQVEVLYEKEAVAPGRRIR